MKDSIKYKIAVLIAVPVIYFFIISGFNTPEVGTETTSPPLITNNPKDFTNCIFTPDYKYIENTYQLYIENNLDKFSDELHFNAIQWYDFEGNERFGYRREYLPQLKIDDYKWVLDQVAAKQLKGFYEKCNYTIPMCGQRLVYEIQGMPDNNDLNYGFVYQTCMQNVYTTDQGRTVLHPRPGIDQPGDLCRNIYENFQHTDLFDFRQNDKGIWYLKPVMKIPTGIQTDLPVVTIQVISFDNDQVKSITISSDDFKDQNGNYNGEYKSEYLPLLDLLQIEGDDATGHLNQGRIDENWNWGDPYSPACCHVDFRVHWEGQVEVWFDKMVVDDEIANELFAPPPNNIWDQYIIQQAEEFTNYGSYYTFYTDEICISQVPCIKYVIKRMRDVTPEYGTDTPKFCIAFSNNLHVKGLKNDNLSYKYFFDSLDVERVQMDIYKFNSSIPNVFPAYDTRIPSDWLKTPIEYNTWLQNSLGDRNLFEQYTDGSFVYQLNKIRTDAKQYSPNTLLISVPQLHSWLNSATEMGDYTGGLREPTNEELRAEAMISLAHGADGLGWFTYESGIWYDEYSEKWISKYGLLDTDYDKRILNMYNQDKWDSVAAMNERLLIWKSTLDAITWQAGFSVHSEDANHYYISDIKSIFRNPSTYEFTPINEDDIKFWEMGFFDDPMSTTTKYLLMVNRRCVPEVYEGAGDFRQLKMKFNSTLPTYRNWKMLDVTDGHVIISQIDKLSNLYYDAGYFMPGEGKLFKLEPTSKGGGTLVADETIPGTEEFTCEDTVWTNSYNLTIQNGAKIHFSDSAKFVVEGGTFTMGNPNQSGQDITMDAAPNGSWKGFEFHGANVGIYNTTFSGLANDSISMLTFVDCPLISLKSNSFNTGTGSNKGCVDINYTDPWQAMSNAYIGVNTFTTGDADIPAVKVMAYSGFTTPVIVEGNNFTGNNTAIFLDNIQGGAVKSNVISGYWSGLTALSSSLDVYNNTISSSANTSYGIQALSGTELRMSYAYGMLLGGLNMITNSGTGTKNIYVDNSYFYMDEGENIFDIGSSSHHLYGWFPDSYQGSYNETENCFKVNSSSVDPPNQNVTLGEQGSQISFTFTPYLTGCQQGDGGDMMAINLGNGIYDTVYVMGGGGSMKGEYIVTPKSIYDSISISIRFRNYNNVKTLCQYLLNTFPDSSQSIGAVSKLYLAVSKTDTSSQSVTALKTFYENLILNHPNNVTLVKRCNYFVQKCKVLLHQYSSALSGFQQIINQNPSNYEGLVARWDYMATSLLMQGQGGAERVTIPFWDEGDDDPTSPLTKEEKKQIKQTVTSVLEVSKTSEKKKIDVLTQLSEKGDELAAVKLKVIKALEQTVKVERPKDIVEHMKIVTNDIKKVFVNPNAGKNKNNSLIPTVFNLSQNYPNPFNPKTKINYDIPKNSFVKLIVYDILGREVIRLVNNEFKQPGRYVVEFNGTNFASGVYFYRIEASDYVNSKKMVLVK